MAEIAARYGAVIAPGVAVQRLPVGASGRPGLIWDGEKNTLVETGPVRSDKSFKFGGGKPRQPVEVLGHRWPSQGAAAQALGVTTAAVSLAIRKGRLAVLVERVLGPAPIRALQGGGPHAA
jgi:hypothetical protein